MPVKKEGWISGKEAAAIMSKNSGHTISPDYVRLLSNQGKLRSRAADGRTKEYFKADIEAYTVKGKGKNKQTEEAAYMILLPSGDDISVTSCLCHVPCNGERDDDE